MGSNGTRATTTTMAICHEYTVRTPTRTRITMGFTTHAMAPHWAKRATVSTSLVTRAVRTPRRVSSRSATLNRWMWAKARTRRSASVSSAMVTTRK